MFVTQVMSEDRSCQNAVNQAAIKSLVKNLAVNSTYTGGYCKARQRLPLALPKEIARFLGRSLEAQVSSSWRWHGRRIRVVDGTSVTMPDTPENQKKYPQQGAQKPGLGFPIARLLAVTDLYTGSVLDVVFGRFQGKGSDEKALLRSVSALFESCDVVLGDAFFPTFIFIADMQAKGVDILMEQFGPRRKNIDFRRGKNRGTNDHVIEISKPDKKPNWIAQSKFDTLPEKILIREFKAKHKVFVTTFTERKIYPKQALSSLYKRRWEIETNFSQIKTILGMNILSCKTPEMVAKEIWVYVLAYNLIRLLMVQSACNVGRKPTDLSFKHCLQLWLCYLQQTAFIDDVAMVVLFKLMAQQRVGNRPGRIEPRALKRRPKAFPMLMKPRAKARDIVRKKGHPKKLK